MNYRVQPVDLQRFSAGVERLPKSGSVVRCPLARSTARRSGTTANGPAANSTEDPDRQVTAADPERKFTHDEWMTAMQRMLALAEWALASGCSPVAVAKHPEKTQTLGRSAPCDITLPCNMARKRSHGARPGLFSASGVWPPSKPSAQIDRCGAPLHRDPQDFSKQDIFGRAVHCQ